MTSTSPRGEAWLPTAVAPSPQRIAETHLSETPSFEDRLEDAAAHRSRQPFSALVSFGLEVRSRQDSLRLLELATPRRTILGGQRIKVRHSLSRLAQTDEVRKWLAGGDFPRRYGAVAVDATADVLLKLAADEGIVASVEEDVELRVCVERVGRMVGCDVAFASDITGRGVKVAVIDTGIDRGHPAFRGRISPMSKSFVRGTEDDDDITDYDGHGTHVAGIIGGDGSGSAGNRFRGIAPESELIIIKITDVTRGHRFNVGDLAPAVEYAFLDCKADVINLSMGTLPPPFDPPWVWSAKTTLQEKAVNGALVNGALPVIAAGNDGGHPSPQSTINFPAISESALTVGSVDLNTRGPALSSFSSQGPVLRTSELKRGIVSSQSNLLAAAMSFEKPDVVAPGGGNDPAGPPTSAFGIPEAYGVISARASANGTVALPSEPYYTTSAGTSMASPVAAGLAALAMEYADTNFPGQISRLERAAIVGNIIREGARDLGLSRGEQGYGLVDWNGVLEIFSAISNDTDSLDNYRDLP